jgi:hypothetical protein
MDVDACFIAFLQDHEMGLLSVLFPCMSLVKGLFPDNSRLGANKFPFAGYGNWPASD